MKKTLLITLMMAGAASVFGQGAIQWGNTFSGFRSPIYGPDPANPSVLTTGNGSLSTPTGSTVFGGPLLQGAGFTFAIYVGSSSATSNQLTLLTSTTFRTATGNVLPAGLVLGGTSTVPGVDAGQQAEFQIRAWANNSGTILDWNSALVAGVPVGASSMVLSGALGGIPTGGGSPFTTPTSGGWSSFSLSSVPEPSSFALMGLASAAMVIFRRRK